jgi:hypothetical protein
MAITIIYDTGPAPQGGYENIKCSTPASQAAFQTAAATALSSQGGFISVTTEPSDGSPETKLINLSKIKSVV